MLSNIKVNSVSHGNYKDTWGEGDNDSRGFDDFSDSSPYGKISKFNKQDQKNSNKDTANVKEDLDDLLNDISNPDLTSPDFKGQKN